MNSNNVYPGCLLISPPTMQDHRFKKSVIILIDHGEQGGSLGLVVNKKLNVGINSLITANSYATMPDIPIFWGGPVNPWGLWMLHSTEWSCDHTWEISDKWAVSSSEEIIESFTYWAVPEHYRLFMGHSSWSHGQLENELLGLDGRSLSDSWLLANEPDPVLLFDENVIEDLWIEATVWSGKTAVNSWL
jgi:putative transcriptional regulator